ncbi:uncharacterized protein GBIM_09663, partial [Gryllus bimaculatus]
MYRKGLIIRSLRVNASLKAPERWGGGGAHVPGHPCASSQPHALTGLAQPFRQAVCFCAGPLCSAPPPAALPKLTPALPGWSGGQRPLPLPGDDLPAASPLGCCVPEGPAIPGRWRVRNPRRHFKDIMLFVCHCMTPLRKWTLRSWDGWHLSLQFTGCSPSSKSVAAHRRGETMMCFSDGAVQDEFLGLSKQLGGDIPCFGADARDHFARDGRRPVKDCRLAKDHPGLRGTPLAMLAAQCNKLSSKSPPPLADAAVGKGFHPWKKSPGGGGGGPGGRGPAAARVVGRLSSHDAARLTTAAAVGGSGRGREASRALLSRP